jgi:TctA family transporter
MDFVFWLVAGVIYGLIIGLVPVAGATTGLIAVFSIVHVFQTGDPYMAIVFTTAVVAASTIGDSFASVVMNIPGSTGSAATMVDGFPLAQQGRATYALSAAITTSTVNGLLWGVIVFVFLPYYSVFMMTVGIPELWALMILAAASVVFVSNRYWVRGIAALALGVFLGLVGTDPNTNADRFTGGWFYLADGIQLVALISGVMAFPELIEGFGRSVNRARATAHTQWQQIWQGLQASWQHRWLGLRGGLIGAVVGALPGLGGAVADWMAYAQTVATNRNETTPFGQGNIKGVIGCEGANNSHKATAYLPTVLFGIPGAPFAAILIGIFAYLGFELGSLHLLQDQQFFSSLSQGYFWALIVTFPIALLGIGYLTRVTLLPYHWFFWPVMAMIVWSSVQYTGGWEDYAALGLFCLLGIILKKIKFGRPALIIGFVLADKIEALTIQLVSLYTVDQLMSRPIFLSIMALSAVIAVYGMLFYRAKIDYV